MGCDIHLRLERRLKKDKKVVILPEEKDENGNVIRKEISRIRSSKIWNNCYIFDSDNTWGDRCYGMFALLNNVRNQWENELKPLEDRGFPTDACNHTKECYSLKIWDKDEELPDWAEDNGYVSQKRANEWLEKGYSTKVYLTNFRTGENDEEYLVSDPDAHSPSWCTTKEMEKCINQIFKDENGNWNGDYIEWVALLNTMKGYELSGEYECRAVFWFDS